MNLPPLFAEAVPTAPPQQGMFTSMALSTQAGQEVKLLLPPRMQLRLQQQQQQQQQELTSALHQQSDPAHDVSIPHIISAQQDPGGYTELESQPLLASDQQAHNSTTPFPTSRQPSLIRAPPPRTSTHTIGTAPLASPEDTQPLQQTWSQKGESAFAIYATTTSTTPTTPSLNPAITRPSSPFQTFPEPPRLPLSRQGSRRDAPAHFPHPPPTNNLPSIASTQELDTNQEGLHTAPSRLSASQVVQEMLRTATYAGIGALPTAGLSAVDSIASSLLGALSGLPRTMVVEAIEFPATEEGYVSQVGSQNKGRQKKREELCCVALLCMH